MKKKILSVCMVVALAAIAVIGGTLAYFTDTEEATNVFMIGNIDVQLIESYYHRESSYMENVPEEDRKSGKVSDEDILASAKEYKDYLSEQVLMPGVSINKMPYVLNTGDNDAYVRIRVMIPKELDADYLSRSVICTSALDKEFTGPVLINGYYDNETKGEYVVYTFTRVEPLKPDEMTYWNVWNTIFMDTEVTNQDLEAMITAGIIKDMSFGVKVQVDAIQADSFTSAADAWAAFDAQTGNSVSTEEYSANAKEGYLTDEIGE